MAGAGLHRPSRDHLQQLPPVSSSSVQCQPPCQGSIARVGTKLCESGRLPLPLPVGGGGTAGQSVQTTAAVLLMQAVMGRA